MTINPAAVLDLDLAALMCSKVCHDVIGPVGAIINGLEVLEDDQDPEMREIAHELIRKSAVQASAKLQFCRLAFGASGSTSAALDLGDAEGVTRGYIGDGNVALTWSVPAEARPKNDVKLLLNLILVGLAGIPRGGDLVVEMDGMDMRVVGTGKGGRVPQNVSDFIAGTLDGDELDARSVQIHYTVALARHMGLEMNIAEAEEGIIITAAPRTAVAA